MIKFSLNGKNFSIKNDISVWEFLLDNGFKLEFIAIERDKKILPKAQWQKAMMSEGQSYEVLEFVGGG